MMLIRTIRQEDYSAVDDLLRSAFSKTTDGYHNEAELVNKIRLDPSYHKKLEVVADDDNQIVGHGLLSEIVIINSSDSFPGLCLAPLAVQPAFQKSGIGTAIINELESRAINQGYQFISVLGWPEYYPKFGYQKASDYGIKAPFPAPDETYMIKELVPNGLRGVNGTVKYLKAFNL